MNRFQNVGEQAGTIREKKPTIPSISSVWLYPMHCHIYITDLKTVLRRARQKERKKMLSNIPRHRRYYGIVESILLFLNGIMIVVGASRNYMVEASSFFWCVGGQQLGLLGRFFLSLSVACYMPLWSSFGGSFRGVPRRPRQTRKRLLYG